MTERSSNSVDQPNDLFLDAVVSGERTDVSVSGEIDIANAHQLVEFLDVVCTRGSSLVVIDLSVCEFLDASGLLPIARLLSHPPAGTCVVIEQSSESIASLLRACGLDAAVSSVVPGACACGRVPIPDDIFCAHCGKRV